MQMLESLRRRFLKLKWLRVLYSLELRWRARLKRESVLAAKRECDIRKQLERAKDEHAETLRRVSRISYHQDRQHGIISVVVQVPALELAYFRDAGDGHFVHIANYMGRMLEREFKQLNMATLAQSIRSAEERQRRLDDDYYRRPWRLAE